jgi:DNA-binding beta-propeller fold protein YncE
MLTQVVAGRVFDFSHVVGRGAVTGMGFTMPVKCVTTKGDTVYVLNRGWEQGVNTTWNKTQRGIRITILTIGSVPGDEELVGEFSGPGDGPGQLIWPTGMAVDNQDRVFVSDEWLNRMSIFDAQGNYLSMWGSSGTGDGQFDGTAGIAFDDDDNIFVVDGRNHRVQKMSKDGRFISKFGSFGSGDGQFNAPWGITIDNEGFVYVADHKNDRVQKFSPEGGYVGSFGSSGDGRGQLKRPSDVAVDGDGDVYVCDWANHRVQIFGPDGHFLTSFIGETRELSKWAQMAIEANPDALKKRRQMRKPEIEGQLTRPCGVTFDRLKERLIVADTQRLRLQLYNKLKNYAEPARTI